MTNIKFNKDDILIYIAFIIIIILSIYSVVGFLHATGIYPQRYIDIEQISNDTIIIKTNVDHPEYHIGLYNGASGWYEWATIPTTGTRIKLPDSDMEYLALIQEHFNPPRHKYDYPYVYFRLNKTSNEIIIINKGTWQ